MGRVTSRYPVLRVSAGVAQRRQDSVAVEEPLEIRLNGGPYVITMRTPGHDIDLVHGLLHSEGVIACSGDVLLARYCAGSAGGVNSYNVLDVSLAPHLEPPTPRAVVTTSACGICGSESIDAVLRRSRFDLGRAGRVSREFLAAAPDRLRSAQRAFDLTGGLHAAGLLDSDGQLSCVREDVGRHNAVDKVIGWAIRENALPLSSYVLVVSGRASYELTQKAVLAGIGILAAVSAPSSLAVDLAQKSGLTLIGFVRGETMNVYAHPQRVVDSDGVGLDSIG